MSSEGMFYLSACLLLPLLWGWLVHRLFLNFRLLERRRAEARERSAERMEEWHYQI
jgi:hypothetical protein